MPDWDRFCLQFAHKSYHSSRAESASSARQQLEADEQCFPRLWQNIEDASGKNLANSFIFLSISNELWVTIDSDINSPYLSQKDNKLAEIETWTRYPLILLLNLMEKPVQARWKQFATFNSSIQSDDLFTSSKPPPSLSDEQQQQQQQQRDYKTSYFYSAQATKFGSANRLWPIRFSRHHSRPSTVFIRSD